MTGVQPVEFEVGDWNKLLLLLGGLHDPINALREFVQNARDAVVDAGLSGKQAVVQVHLEDLRQGRVVVFDNGVGMPEEKLRRLFREICSSEKLKRVDLEGRFGIGLLSYLAIADECEIVSRATGRRETWKLVFPKRSELERPGQGRPQGRLERVREEREICGTDVILRGVHEHIAGALTAQRVVSHLQRHYGPQIEEGVFTLLVIGRGKGRSQRPVCHEVRPFRYRGELFRREVATQYGKVTFELYLHPRANGRCVHLLVGPSALGDITRAIPSGYLDRPPWNEGRMEGEVRCDYLEPNPTRSQVVYHPEKLRAFLRAVADVEPMLHGQLESLSRQQLGKERDDVLAAIQRAFVRVVREELIEHDFRTAIEDPSGEEAAGEPVDERVPGGTQERQGERQGTATVRRVDRDQAKQTARQRLRAGLGLKFEEHDNPAIHCWSDRGIIYINTANPHYARISHDPGLEGTYLVACIAKEMALSESRGSREDVPEVLVARLAGFQRVLNLRLSGVS